MIMQLFIACRRMFSVGLFQMILLSALAFIAAGHKCQAGWESGSGSTEMSTNIFEGDDEEAWGDWHRNQSVSGSASWNAGGVSVVGSASSSADLEILPYATGVPYNSLSAFSVLHADASYWWDGPGGGPESLQIHASISLYGEASNFGEVRRYYGDGSGNASSFGTASGGAKVDTEGGNGYINRGLASVAGVANPDYFTVDTYSTIGDETDHDVYYDHTVDGPFEEAWYVGGGSFSIEFDDDYECEAVGESFSAIVEVAAVASVYATASGDVSTIATGSAWCNGTALVTFTP